jgi:outer membrane receptor protein involved in Fe transport
MSFSYVKRKSAPTNERYRTNSFDSLRSFIFFDQFSSRAFAFAPLLLIFLTANFAFPTFAQTFAGTVSDAQNAPVQNAEATLISRNKIVAKTKTDADGKFSLNGNGAQNFLLSVKASGFSSFSKTLPENFNEPLNIVLSPAAVSADVSVSIARTDSRLSETPASIVVLNRETLNQTAAQTIDDTLRQVAGFTLFRRGSSKTTNPTTQGANLRGVSGSGASRATVLFDGFSLNDAFGGWTFWSRVPEIAVEQAEVLRGGASSIYGDAALSGTVNLTTRRAENNQPIFRFETSGGLQKTFDGSIFTAYAKNSYGVNFAYDAFQTAGYIPTAEAERGAIDTRANSRHNNGLLTLEKRFRSEPPAVAGGSTRENNNANFFENARIFLRGNLFAERRDNGTSLTNNGTYFRQGAFGADFENGKLGAFQFRSFLETQTYDQTFSAISNNRNTETLSRVQRVPSQASGANLFWSNAFNNHAVAASVELRQVRGASDETVFVNNNASSLLSAGGRQKTFSVFAQDFWRVSQKLNVNFGARFDTWENYDALSSVRSLTTNLTNVARFTDRNESAFSPRIAALYQINQNFSLYGSYAKSFRAPTLNELYRAFRVGNVLTQANENLQSERADTFETGVNFTGLQSKLNLRANVFQTEVSNPVVSVTLTATPSLITRQRQNVGQTRTRGLEFDAEYFLRKDLRFSASYLLASSRVADFPANANLVGKFLPQIPRQQLNFQIFYRPQNKFSAGLQSRLSAAQFEDDLNTLRLRPFATFDVFAAYKLPKNFEIFTAIENLFDNSYDIGLTPNRTVAAPRFVRVGLRFDLGNK